MRDVRCAGYEDLTSDVEIEDGVMEGTDFSEDISDDEAQSSPRKKSGDSPALVVSASGQRVFANVKKEGPTRIAKHG